MTFKFKPRIISRESNLQISKGQASKTMAICVSPVDLMFLFAEGSEGFFPGGCIARLTPQCDCAVCRRKRGLRPTIKSNKLAARKAAAEFDEICALARRALGYGIKDSMGEGKPSQPTRMGQKLKRRYGGVAH